MRRVLSLLLLFTFLVSACGPDSADDDAPIAGLDATPAPSAQAANPTAAPTSGATISFAAWETELPVYERLAATFHEQNPDINVVVVPMEDLTNVTDPNAPQDPVTQLRRLVSGADTMPMYYIAPEVLSANLLLDMKPLMDGDSNFDRDDFYAGVLERGTYPKGTFVLPRYVYAQILYYNKDLFKKAELPEPKSDWSWNDLFGVAEQIASSGNENYGFFDYSGGFNALLNEIDTRNLKILETPAADVDLTAPEFVEVLTKINGMLDNRTLFSGNYKQGAPDPQQVVRDGRVGIFPAELFLNGGPRPMDGPIAEAGPAPQEPLPFEVGKVAYPRTTSSFGNNSAVEGYSISAGTQHPNEAWKWIEFLSHQRLDNDMAQGGSSFSPGRIPARQSLAKEIGYWDTLDAETKTAYEAALAQQVTQLTTTPDYTVFSALSQAVYDMTGNGTKPEQALKTAQDYLKEQIAQLAQLTPTPKPETGGPVVVATPAPQVAPEGATAVTFDATGFQASVFRRLARQFNEQKNGFFVEIKSTQTMTQPLTLAQSAETSDCLASYSSPQSSEDFAALLDLRPLFEADATFKREDYPPAVLAQFSSNGGVYGLPYSFNVRNLTYNKTIFDAVGQSAPSGDWKPDDFLAAAKALTSGSGNDKIYGYVPYGGGPAGDLAFFVNQFGGQMATGTGKDVKPNFSDPKVVQAIQWYIDLAKVHEVTPKFTIPYRPDDQYNDQSYDLVINGRAGMWLDYGYGSFEGGVKGSDGQDLKWEPAYAPLPVGGAGLQTGDLWARGFYISATTQQQQGCWEWLKFLSNDTSNLNGELPARISVATSAEFKQSANPGQLKIYELYKDVLQKPSTVNTSMNSLYSVTPYGLDMFWFYKAIDETIQKDADLAEGLKTADELTKAHIACVLETKKPATCAKQVDPNYNGYNTQDPDPNQQFNGAKG